MDKIATPDLSHLSSVDFENVYEPAEDSFLLLDALESELMSLRAMKPSFCLEVGTGSGVVVTALAKALGPNCVYLGTDINPVAAKISRKTADKNCVAVNVVNCDLIGPFLPRIENKIDVLVFNPPYVPTDEAEFADVDCQPIALSWAGGPRGRIVMDRIFPLIPRIMSPTGVFYLLIVRENDEEDIFRIMRSYGWRGSVVNERRAGREFLKVLRFQCV